MPRTDERWTEYQPLDDLVPAKSNPKRHDVPAIVASLKRFGLTKAAALVDERTGRMVAGHGRREALIAIRDDQGKPPKGVAVDPDGVWLVPVSRGWRSKNDREALAELLSDNRTSEIGGWDRGELGAAATLLGERGLIGTGYSLGQFAPAAAPEPESDTDELPVPSVAEAGDVWHIGPHRLMVGDCRNPDHVATLLDGATVNLAVTSPPYADRRKYDGSSDFRPIPPARYVAWFEPVAAIVADHLAADGSFVVNIKAGAKDLDRDLYVLDLVIAHVREWGWHLADDFVWTRNGVPKQPVQRLKNQHEPVYQFTRGRWKFRPEHVMHETNDAIIAAGPGRGNTSWADPNSNVVSQGQKGDVFAGQRAKGKRTGRGDTSWSGKQGSTGACPPDFEPAAEGMAYPGNLLPTFAGKHEAVGHPAAYPWGLPEFFAKLMTDEGDVVFDPFGGSGSTLLAAHHTNRIGYAIEISPGYTDEALARLHRDTGHVPTCEGKEYPT